MSWVVEEIVQRVINPDRDYAFDEWKQFCEDYGIDVLIHNLPTTLPGFMLFNTVVIQPNMSPEDTAKHAWHEIFHVLAHVGNREEWRRMVCGDLILNKFERQADDFAEIFPEWEA